jgi:hypothetical protein
MATGYDPSTEFERQQSLPTTFLAWLCEVQLTYC